MWLKRWRPVLQRWQMSDSDEYKKKPTKETVVSVALSVLPLCYTTLRRKTGKLILSCRDSYRCGGGELAQLVRARGMWPCGQGYESSSLLKDLAGLQFIPQYPTQSYYSDISLTLSCPDMPCSVLVMLNIRVTLWGIEQWHPAWEVDTVPLVHLVGFSVYEGLVSAYSDTPATSPGFANHFWVAHRGTGVNSHLVGGCLNNYSTRI